MKTAELTGAALDWAVASAKGYSKLALTISGESKEFKKMHDEGYHNYSIDWAQGGPIIEREGICLFRNNEKNYWFTSKARNQIGTGETPLLAAMRCYVESKLGDTVEIPEGLK